MRKKKNNYGSNTINKRPLLHHLDCHRLDGCVYRQDGSYIEAIYTHDFYKEKLNYIHMNPVRQEIVERPEEYLYSSALNYCGEKGLLEVTVLT